MVCVVVLTFFSWPLASSCFLHYKSKAVCLLLRMGSRNVVSNAAFDFVDKGLIWWVISVLMASVCCFSLGGDKFQKTWLCRLLQPILPHTSVILLMMLIYIEIFYPMFWIKIPCLMPDILCLVLFRHISLQP